MLRAFYAGFVPGWAKTKGSVEAVPRRNGKGTYVSQSVQGSTDWARIVEDHVRRTFRDADGKQREKRTGAVRVTLTYWLPCAAEQLTVKGAHGNGDIDKLERNVLDALERAGIYANDAQVLGVVHEKRSALDESHAAGVEIAVFEGVRP